MCVDHVDMVQREDQRTGYPFYIAYVHFTEIKDIQTFEESGGNVFLDKINANQEVRLVYRDPWFWKVRKNTKTKHARKGPRILADEDAEDFMAYQKKVIARRRARSEKSNEEHSQGDVEEGEISGN